MLDMQAAKPSQKKTKIKKRENQFRFSQYEYAMKKIMDLNIRHLKDLASINANLIICQAWYYFSFIVWKQSSLEQKKCSS